MRLEGQVAIITGVSHAGQVGYALAAAFAREGALLSISARTASRVNARAGELRAAGAQVIAIPADLTTEEGAHTRIQETLGASGQITVLVNLAGGLTTSKPPDEFSLAEWEAELNNNLRSAFLCTGAVWPVMKRQGGGKILNFSRAGGVQSSRPLMLAYNCAKAGIDALTYTFARAGKEHMRQFEADVAAIDLQAVQSAGPLSARAILQAVNRIRQCEMILVEGGPQLMGDFFAEGLLDELFLTLAPQVAGRDGEVERPGLMKGKRFAPEHPLWGTLKSVKRAGSHLFLRYAFEAKEHV